MKSSENRSNSKAEPVKAAVMTYLTKNAQWPGKNTQLYKKKHLIHILLDIYNNE